MLYTNSRYVSIASTEKVIYYVSINENRFLKAIYLLCVYRNLLKICYKLAQVISSLDCALFCDLLISFYPVVSSSLIKHNRGFFPGFFPSVFLSSSVIW